MRENSVININVKIVNCDKTIKVFFKRLRIRSLVLIDLLQTFESYDMREIRFTPGAICDTSP